MGAVRYAAAVGKDQIGAKARSAQEIGAELRVLPQVGHAARGRHPLLVVQVDVVVRDVREILRREVELRRVDVLAFCSLNARLP